MPKSANSQLDNDPTGASPIRPDVPTPYEGRHSPLRQSLESGPASWEISFTFTSPLAIFSNAYQHIKAWQRLRTQYVGCCEDVPELLEYVMQILVPELDPYTTIGHGDSYQKWIRNNIGRAGIGSARSLEECSIFGNIPLGVLPLVYCPWKSSPLLHFGHDLIE